MTRLRQLFYLSRAATKLTDVDIRQIVQTSQRNNRRKDITGCLLYSGQHFAQVLEGDAAALDELVARIAKDSRHSGFVVVIDREVSVRRFPDWSMGILYKLDIAKRMDAFSAPGGRPRSSHSNCWTK